MTKAAVFQDPMFQDEDKAREALEAVRWPEDPVCPHCGSSDPDKLAKMKGPRNPIALACITATTAKVSSP